MARLLDLRRGSAVNAMAFNATAPPLQPRTEESSMLVYEDDDGSEVLDGPPAGSDPLATVIDRFGAYRGYISKADGSCHNNKGRIIAFINVESLEAGTVDESYLGSINDSVDGGEATVHDALDEAIATLDLGKAKVKGANGSTLCDIKADGAIKSGVSENLGQLEGLGYKDLRLIALYICLVDPGMVSRREEEANDGGAVE